MNRNFIAFIIACSVCVTVSESAMAGMGKDEVLSATAKMSHAESVRLDRHVRATGGAEGPKYSLGRGWYRGPVQRDLSDLLEGTSMTVSDCLKTFYIKSASFFEPSRVPRGNGGFNETQVSPGYLWDIYKDRIDGSYIGFDRFSGNYASFY